MPSNEQVPSNEQKALNMFNYVQPARYGAEIIFPENPNPENYGPGIINNFTWDELNPAPAGNYYRNENVEKKIPGNRLIKPWLLSDKYPDQAVFVYGDPFDWFRGGGYEKLDWDKKLVLDYLSTKLN